MHELSLSSAIVATVTKHADGLPVSAVKLRVGALRQVVPDSLAFYFDLVARDTICEGARLEQTLVPGRMQCSCGHEWSLDSPSFRCPACGAGNAQIVSGEEFEVESIMVEEQKERSSRRATERKQKSASSSAGS